MSIKFLKGIKDGKTIFDSTIAFCIVRSSSKEKNVSRRYVLCNQKGR